MSHDDERDELEFSRFRREVPHSGLGIAAFVLALFAGFLLFLLLIVAGVLTSRQPGGLGEPTEMALGCGALISLNISLLGLGLSLGACFQAHRHMLFPVLGLVFNGLVLLGFIGIMIVGVLVQ